MFVKLMFTDGREAVYQCDRFFIGPTQSSFDHSALSLESNHPNGSVFLGDLDRSKVSIFVMNDQGKTIESYQAVALAAK